MADRHILIIVENLPVPFDRRVWQEATTLAAAGYEVSVICPLDKELAPEPFVVLDGIHVHRHSLPVEARGLLTYLVEYPAALFHEFRLAWRIWRKKPFDALHACNPPDTIFLIGAFFKAIFGVRFVFDHHDINPELFEAKFGRRGPLYWLLVLLERLTFATADMSIATNGSYREIALERGKMKAEDVFVVRSGPKLSRLRIMLPSVEVRRGFRFVVGYVGVIGQQEAIDLLLESIRYIVRDLGRDDIRFVIVGGGPELAAMRELAGTMELDAFVEFTGRVSDERLLEVLNSCDLCVNPDRANAMNDKSTMNKIMEYMALGKPIVQYDLTEGRVSAQDASLYAAQNDTADFAKKVVELLDNPERRQAMSKYGLRRVREELSWEHEAPKLLAAYDHLFSRKGR